MDLFEVIRERRSVRAYAREPVTEEQLLQILEAARQAPSAGNLQAVEIFVARGEAARARLARAAFGQEFVAQAPVVVVFCAHPARSAEHYGRRGTRLYAPQDATIACTFAMLAATALGLATVWVGAFDDDAVRKAIGAPEALVPVAVLPIGRAAESPGPAGRRALDDLVHEVRS